VNVREGGGGKQERRQTGRDTGSEGGGGGRFETRRNTHLSWARFLTRYCWASQWAPTPLSSAADYCPLRCDHQHRRPLAVLAPHSSSVALPAPPCSQLPLTWVLDEESGEGQRHQGERAPRRWGPGGCDWTHWKEPGWSRWFGRLPLPPP
jgi:hypothetical protein